MDLLAAIMTRRSVRSFEDREVEHEKIWAILNAANRAPSAGNLQAYDIFIVRDALRRKAVAEATKEQECVARAPIILAFCADPQLSAQRYGDRGRYLFSLQDATIACSFAMLAATALALGSVWVGSWEDDDAMRRAIGAPADRTPVALLLIGYPADEPHQKKRKSLSDLVHEMK